MELEMIPRARKAMIEEFRIRLLTALTAQHKIVSENPLFPSGRDRLFLEDKINDVLYTDLVSGRGASGGDAPPRKTLEITAVARELGYNADLKACGVIGRAMAKMFREAFPGKEIPKTSRFIDGAVRSVNWYEDVPEVRALMEKAVTEFAAESGLRPVQQRRLR
eukprot:jgi/Mesvir1/14649/Mv05319-RA.1